MIYADMAIRVGETYEKYRDLYITDLSKALNLRDAAQAWLVLRWMKEKPADAKAVLLEHNLHVSKKQSVVIPQGSERGSWRDVRSTGEVLIGNYGTAYRSILLTGYEVSSTRDGNYPLPTAADSLDRKLSEQGDFLLVNPKAPWIRSQGMWWMHAEHSPNGMYQDPAAQADGIVFLKRSEAAVPWTPPSPQPEPLL